MKPAIATRKKYNWITFCRIVGGALLLLGLVVPVYSCGPWPGGPGGRATQVLRPSDELISAAEHFGTWVSPGEDTPPETSANALRDLLQSLATGLGFWCANLGIGVCAWLWRPRSRSPALIVPLLILGLHLLRWPGAMTLATGRSWVAGDSLPTLADWFWEGATAPSWAAALAPLLVLHAIVLIRRAAGRAVAPLLLVWSLWSLAVLHLALSLSDWGELWIAPFHGDLGSIGLPIIWLGVVLVGLAAVLKVIVDAPSVPAAIAMVLWGYLPAGAETRVCPECEYSLVGLTSERCPECGTVIGQHAANAAAASHVGAGSRN